MIDDRTPKVNLPKPSSLNTLLEDVDRLRSAFDTLDTYAAKDDFSIKAFYGGGGLTITALNLPIRFGIYDSFYQKVDTKIYSSDAYSSIVIPDGATLGVSNGSSVRLLVLAVYDNPSVSIAVINADGMNTDESRTITKTVISSGSSSASTIYGTGFGGSGYNFRIIGYIDLTQTTAGVWSSGLTIARVQTVFGESKIKSGLFSRNKVTASGTAIDLSVESWARRVTLMFSGLSTNGSSNLIAQLGTPGSFVTSGYAGGISSGNNAIVTSNMSSGFDVSLMNASSAIHGHVVLTNAGGGLWVMSGTAQHSNQTTYAFSAGSVTLAGYLSRVRLTAANGTDSFDAGSVNILYE